jgi:cell division protein FtsW
MRFVSGDRVFLVLVLLLTLAGLAIYSSAKLGMLARDGGSISQDILLQTVVGFGLGFLLLGIARWFPMSHIKRFAPYIYGFTLILTALVFIPGVGLHLGGATRWINLGFTTVQPAEFLKIGLIVAVAWWLAPRTKQFTSPKKGIYPLLIILAPAVSVLALQPNNSTALLLIATAGAMYFAAGAPLRDFGMLLLCATLAFTAIIITRPYVRERVMTFINPSENSLGSGYQIQQSLIAIGSGRLLGKGIGQSAAKFNYLPEPDGDSVFAVFAEEAGFVGSTLLLLLFLALAARGIVIAGNSHDLFGGLVAFGASFIIIVQTFVNMCAMLGIIPLTGLPLPFVSHGGTALLALLIMCGLVLNVAAHKTR